MRKPSLPVILFLFLGSIVLLDRQSAHADCRSFSPLIDNGSYAVADQTGRILSSCNKDTSFIPASVIKIPLALAAFDILGTDFRFTTEFYMDREDNLYIRGNGDPFLISEEVDLILDRLIDKGMRAMNGIFVDNTAYGLRSKAPGRGTSDNPYDVPVNPVVVNFNTVNIRVAKDGTIVSAEPQTPTLPIMQDIGKNLSPGQYRLNICQNDCAANKQSARYTAELFRALQHLKGIPGTGPAGIGQVPAGAVRLYAHKNSRDLEEVIFSFLKYSNNLVANQVFLRCGIEPYGKPASWEKAGKAVKASLSRLLGAEVAQKILIEDGAGLSRNNKVAASAMLTVLEKFKPFAHLMQEKKDANLKSGTLDGVYNYAGYLNDSMPFVILLNQKRNTRDNVMTQLNNQLIRK